MRILCLIFAFTLAAIIGCESRSLQPTADVPYTIDGDTMRVHITGNRTTVELSSVDLKQINYIKVETDGQETKLLLRVSDQSPAKMFGAVDAPSTCSVYIIAPGGIIFGEHARVDVGKLVAAAGHIDDAGFLNDVSNFTDNLTGIPFSYGQIVTPPAAQDDTTIQAFNGFLWNSQTEPNADLTK